MRVIPFPSSGAERPGDAWLTELEAALDGSAEGPRADSWRELRGNVRALAPPMSPEFERELSERIAERSARRSEVGQPHREKQSYPSKEQHRPGQRHPLREWHRRFGRLRPTPPALAAVSVACAVIAALLIAAPWRPAGYTAESSARSSSLAARADRFGPAFGPAESAAVAGARAGKVANAGRASSSGAVAGASASAGAATIAPTASGPAAAPGRVQQLGASIRLATTPGEVQSTADHVSRLATSEGGYTQSSQVNTGEGAGEANLTLSLPSAKLSAALASLGGLAPVRAESQTLQDITNSYDAARQRLNDATAERQALLRALAKASTEGEIDSLRERIAQNRGAIANARTAFQEVSQRASTSEVEVTVVGDRSVGRGGLTLNQGLHDAGRVLVVTLAVLLIAAAVLLPLALLVAALATGRRAWRRHRRERVLDAR